MRKSWKIKKHNFFKLVTTSLLGIVIMTGLSTKSYAAPKQMPDGNIFDAEFYAATYPDIVTALGTDETILYNHYVHYGNLDGRLPHAPGATVPVTPLTNIPSSNIKVMPDGNKFDSVFYATTYPDVAAILGTDETVLYNHYLLCGINEGGHTVIILTKADDYVTVAESNYRGPVVHWGRKISKEILRMSLCSVYSSSW